MTQRETRNKFLRHSKRKISDVYLIALTLSTNSVMSSSSQRASATLRHSPLGKHDRPCSKLVEYAICREVLD